MKAKITNSSSLENVIQYVPFDVTVEFDYATNWSKALADIDDVKFVFKKSDSSADSDYLVKDYPDTESDISIDDGTKVFTISIKADDFTKLVPGGYSTRLGILFDGETQYRDCGEIQFGKITVKKSWFDFVEPEQ